MVDVDVEMDGVGKVVRGGEGAEAAGERVEAIEGEDFDYESESGATVGGAQSEARDRVPVGGRGDGGRVEVRVEEEGGDGKEEDEDRQAPSFWDHRHSGCSHCQRRLRDASAMAILESTGRGSDTGKEIERQRQSEPGVLRHEAIGGTPALGLLTCFFIVKN